MSRSLVFALFILCALSSLSDAFLKKNSLCDICENVVDKVDDVLKHGGDIEKAVDDFCKNDVPEFFISYCEKIVLNNLKFIIEKLKEHDSAEQICASLQLCAQK